MEESRRVQRFERVERATELPMLILALAMIPLLLVPLLVDLPTRVDRGFFAANWLVWFAFAVELVVKTYLAPDRRGYLRTHWIDVLIVVLPFLRPLRLVRSTRLLRLVRTTRMLSVAARAATSARRVLTRHGLAYVLAAGAILVVVAAGAVTFAERDAVDRTIGDYPTALWWAATTVTTVGYGDTAPVTAEGRALGVLLMFVGIGVFSLLTASVAAFLVEQPAATKADGAAEDELAAMRRSVVELTEELRRTRQMTGG